MFSENFENFYFGQILGLVDLFTEVCRGKVGHSFVGVTDFTKPLVHLHFVSIGW